MKRLEDEDEVDRLLREHHECDLVGKAQYAHEQALLLVRTTETMLSHIHGGAHKDVVRAIRAAQAALAVAIEKLMTEHKWRKPRKRRTK